MRTERRCPRTRPRHIHAAPYTRDSARGVANPSWQLGRHSTRGGGGVEASRQNPWRLHPQCHSTERPAVHATPMTAVFPARGTVEHDED
eukprot:COSAG02_NODE_18227_length_952_cov_1.386870_1_plen_88_part_10